MYTSYYAVSYYILLHFSVFLLVRTALQPQWSLAFILAEGQVSKLRVWTSLLGIPGIPSLAMHLMQRLRASHSMYFQVPVLLLAVHSVRMCSVSKPHARCKQTSRETDVVCEFLENARIPFKGLGAARQNYARQPLSTTAAGVAAVVAQCLQDREPSGPSSPLSVSASRL